MPSIVYPGTRVSELIKKQYFKNLAETDWIELY
jgi:hypothetical protein